MRQLFLRGPLVILCCPLPHARSPLGQRRRLLTLELSWLPRLWCSLSTLRAALGRLRMTRFRLRGSTLFPGRIFYLLGSFSEFLLHFVLFTCFSFLSVCVYLGAMTPFPPVVAGFVAEVFVGGDGEVFELADENAIILPLAVSSTRIERRQRARLRCLRTMLLQCRYRRCSPGWDCVTHHQSHSLGPR